MFGRWIKSLSGISIKKLQSPDTKELPQIRRFQSKPYVELNTSEKKAFWAENPVNGDIKIELPFRSDELKMRCDNDDTVVKELHWTGYTGWEPVSLKLWHRLSCQQADSYILDVGSYSGIYSIIAAQNSPTAHVLAFDIQQRCVDRVKYNTDLNSIRNIEPILAACGDENGFCKFYFYEEANVLSSVASIVPKKINNKSERVKVLRLDTLLGDMRCLDRVGLIKIDVEDAEVSALLGMQEILMKSKPDLLVEINRKENIENVGDTLPGFYFIYEINEETGYISLVDADDTSERGCRNYFITTKEPSDIFSLSSIAPL